jgi:hypothetical protein
MEGVFVVGGVVVLGTVFLLGMLVGVRWGRPRSSPQPRRPV